MKKTAKKRIWQRHMLRPLVYLTATRLMAAGIFLLLVSYIPNGPADSLTAGFLAVFFLLLAYLVYLRLDGMRVPRMKYFRPKKKNDPLRHAASMVDHMDDDPPVTFEELEDEEKDLCSLLANLAGLALFTALSFLL